MQYLNNYAVNIKKGVGSMEEKSTKEKSGLATAALVLGIIGICLSFIPILNNVSFVLGILAVIFAVISLAKKKSKGKAIASLILGVLSVVITLSLQSSWSESLDEASKDLDNLSGNNTEEILEKYVDVTLGDLSITEDEYGLTETSMNVTVKNKADETKSFSIQVEAVDSEGKRIDDDYVYANSLSAGQSQDFEIFNYIEDSKLDSMRNATFNIVEVTMN